MDSMRAISPDCTSIHALLTKFPSRISTSPKHAARLRVRPGQASTGRGR